MSGAQELAILRERIDAAYFKLHRIGFPLTDDGQRYCKILAEVLTALKPDPLTPDEWIRLNEERQAEDNSPPAPREKWKATK